MTKLYCCSCRLTGWMTTTPSAVKWLAPSFSAKERRTLITTWYEKQSWLASRYRLVILYQFWHLQLPGMRNRADWLVNIDWFILYQFLRLQLLGTRNRPDWLVNIDWLFYTSTWKARKLQLVCVQSGTVTYGET